jgi:CHAT domain-containing protein/Tfp pilus assembly protein PilF
VSPTTPRFTAVLPLLLAVASAGCGPLIQVRATIRADEMTRLEREALGKRSQPPVSPVLLDLSPERPGPIPERGRDALEESYVALESRLEASVPATTEVRVWQAVCLHNRGVLAARSGDVALARQLLARAEDHARAYWLFSLLWQVHLTESELGGDGSAEHLAEAARILAEFPPLAALDHEMEDPLRRDRLYALLIDAHLAEDPEVALTYALEREAVELARAVPPHALEPPGSEVAGLLARFEAARADAAAARQERCKLPLSELSGGVALSAAKPWQDVARAADDLRVGSPAGGLVVPGRPDPNALLEALTPSAALLVYAPLPAGEVAAFLLTPAGFEARRLAFVGPAPTGDALRAEAAASLLRPVVAALGEETERLYLALPGSLSGMPWQTARVGERMAGEQYDLAFLGGAADLLWASHPRRYGREAVLICSSDGPRLAELASSIPGDRQVTTLNMGQASRDEFARSLAFTDYAWTDAPVVLDQQAPEGSFVAWPGALGRLGAVTVGEAASYRTTAATVALAGLPQNAFSPQSHLALRVLLRALAAAGAPAVLCGADAADEADVWAGVLGRLGSLPASGALAASLAGRPADVRCRFRLYGFAGLNSAEYAEYSKLDFNDALRRARADLDGGRAEDAAAGFLNLAHMAGALEFASPQQKSLVLANVEQYLVRCWRALRRYGDAARHQELRIGHLIAHGQTPGAAVALERQSLGALLTLAERYDEAVAQYEVSLDLMRRHGGEAEVVRVLGELGKSLDRAARYDRALETFEEALASYRQMHEESGMAQQHQRIGAICLRRLSSAIRAGEHFQEAIVLYQRVGDAAAAADATIDLGLCRRHMGQFGEAMTLFDETLATGEQLQSPRLVSRSLAETANTRWLRGEYQEALESVIRANAVAQGAGDDLRLSAGYQLLALTYWELNEYGRAHEALDAALEAAVRAESLADIASAHNNRGVILRREGHYDEAVRAFQQALGIDTRLQSRWGQGYDHRNLGMTYHRMNRLEAASEHLARAVELSREIGDRVNLARALQALGELRIDQGRPHEADQPLVEALGEARAMYLPEVEWRALKAMSHLHKLQGDPHQAWQACRQAVDVVEGLGAALRLDELRTGFLTNKMDLYEDAVALLLEMDRPDEAFHYAERARSRRFLDILGGRRVDLKTDAERRLYDEQQELLGRMGALREEIARERDEERRGELARSLEELKQRYSDVLLEIRLANPELAAFVTLDAATAEEAAAFVPAGVALVCYFLLQDSVVAWVVADGRVSSRRTRVDRDRLGGQVRDLRLMVQNREPLEDVLRASRALHTVLIAPLADLIRGADVLGIVPYGALHYLSFACLHDGEQFLVERFPLFHDPSASVFGQAMSREPLAGKRSAHVLAIGNPDVGDPAYELPFTEREVASIQRDFDAVVALTGPDASEDNLRGRIGQFDIVHIGAHGHFDAANPLFSNLVLAPHEEDGLLHLHEVTGLDIDAQLLALSACQSGLGELRSGDELVGLSRAFAYAGARSILSTLWRVDDVATALVSKHFYRRYAESGAADSLRHGQLQVMNDGRHAHPTYWAGVVLSGDYR